MSEGSDSALLGIQAGRRNSQPFWNGTQSKLTGLIQGRAYLRRRSLYRGRVTSLAHEHDTCEDVAHKDRSQPQDKGGATLPEAQHKNNTQAPTWTAPRPIIKAVADLTKRATTPKIHAHTYTCGGGWRGVNNGVRALQMVIHAEPAGPRQGPSAPPPTVMPPHATHARL